MAAVRVYIERSFAAILTWVDGSFKEPPPWKERKKNGTIFWRSASLRPALFQEKEELEFLDKTSVKKFETRSNYFQKFLTIYIFLLLFCLFLDNEPHSVT